MGFTRARPGIIVRPLLCERSDFQEGAAESGCGLYFWRGRALSFAHSCANEKDGLFALGRDAWQNSRFLQILAQTLAQKYFQTNFTHKYQLVATFAICLIT